MNGFQGLLVGFELSAGRLMRSWPSICLLNSIAYSKPLFPRWGQVKSVHLEKNRSASVSTKDNIKHQLSQQHMFDITIKRISGHRGRYRLQGNGRDRDNMRRIEDTYTTSPFNQAQQVHDQHNQDARMIIRRHTVPPTPSRHHRTQLLGLARNQAPDHICHMSHDRGPI